eukprot:29734-Pelagococcus_subviridis.AAC.1
MYNRSAKSRDDDGRARAAACGSHREHRENIFADEKKRKSASSRAQFPRRRALLGASREMTSHAGASRAGLSRVAAVAARR